MDNYEDIIYLPHHVSTRHPQMPLADRAAQFAPFAALTGHGAAIMETARLTEEHPDLAEEPLQELDGKMRALREMLSERPEVSITWFRPDDRKAGGAWQVTAGRLKKIDDYARLLILEDGSEIAMENIREIAMEIVRADND